MKFFEYMAKRIFNEEGIPILEGHVANSAEEATSIASDMGVPVAIKSQVLVGGRGKAGGIKFADNPGEAYKVADSLIGTTINGERVHQLLIEKKANIIKRSYMVNDQMIICILNNEIYDQKDLAEVADELIQFEDVEASFVIGKIEQNKVSISARSIGNINVQQIMNSLGGGGSQTSAAAQFQDKTIREAKEKLLKIIILNDSGKR